MSSYPSFEPPYAERPEDFPPIVSTRFRLGRIFIWLIALLCICIAGATYTTSSPRDFPQDGAFIELRGGSMDSVIATLHRERIIRYRTPLKIIIKLTGREKSIQAGEYYFEKPIGALSVAARLAGGRFNIRTSKLSIPEGLTSYEIADRAAKVLNDFDKVAFLRAATPKEGRLFPDTYFIPTNMTEVELVRMMEANFERKIENLLPGIKASKRSLSQIITMASILEEEGRTQVDRDMIAGILWHRFNIGMPLQVDAVFSYEKAHTAGKNTYTLTKADLTTDNPYNTYTRKGLPPTAISNPGLESLRAAIWPAGNPYLYYLSERDGTMHYARDFEGHKTNREKYLRK